MVAKTTQIILFVFLIVSVFVAFVFALRMFTQPVGTPPVYSFLDKTVTVEAGTYNVYNVSIPSQATGAQVTGHFNVTTGDGDIAVYVMDSVNLDKWQNGQNPSMYYNSGEATEGSIDFNLTSGGTYCLVLDNTFGVNSPKNVTVYSSYWYSPF